MRYKWVPDPPADPEAVAAARRAVPLVPAAEGECLTRLRRRSTGCGIDDRETAREWLTFLRALGLVERRASGYVRTREPVDADVLRERLLGRVYGARELLAALSSADGSLPVDEALDRASVDQPTWERLRHGAEWERTWRARQQRLLEWLVLLGAAERTADGRLRAPGETPATE